MLGQALAASRVVAVLAARARAFTTGAVLDAFQRLLVGGAQAGKAAGGMGIIRLVIGVRLAGTTPKGPPHLLVRRRGRHAKLHEWIALKRR